MADKQLRFFRARVGTDVLFSLDQVSGVDDSAVKGHIAKLVVDSCDGLFGQNPELHHVGEVSEVTELVEPGTQAEGASRKLGSYLEPLMSEAEKRGKLSGELVRYLRPRIKDTEVARDDGVGIIQELDDIWQVGIRDTASELYPNDPPKGIRTDAGQSISNPIEFSGYRRLNVVDEPVDPRGDIITGFTIFIGYEGAVIETIDSFVELNSEELEAFKADVERLVP